MNLRVIIPKIILIRIFGAPQPAGNVDVSEEKEGYMFSLVFTTLIFTFVKTIGF